MTTVPGSNLNSTNRSTPQRRRRTARVASTPVPISASSSQPIHLKMLAQESGVDICDVACDAMPGHVLGDLDTQDDSWLLNHTATCGYCQRMLGCYERLDTVLDRIPSLTCEELPPPPRFAIPSMPRAAYAQVESPLGPLFVAATDVGVCELGFCRVKSESAFERQLKARGFRPVPDANAIANVARQLREYFGGMRDHFEVPLDFSGVSPFAQSVLTATSQVPFGHVSTYRDIAQQVGRPSASRAVGNALGKNPIAVIVPCHRVVRSDHSLGGYTGGVEIKEHLLTLEGIKVSDFTNP